MFSNATSRGAARSSLSTTPSGVDSCYVALIKKNDISVAVAHTLGSFSHLIIKSRARKRNLKFISAPTQAFCYYKRW